MKAPLEAAECHGALKCSGTPPTRSRCSLEATRDAISQSGRFDESSAREETESWELEMCTLHAAAVTVHAEGKQRGCVGELAPAWCLLRRSICQRKLASTFLKQ